MAGPDSTGPGVGPDGSGNPPIDPPAEQPPDRPGAGVWSTPTEGDQEFSLVKAFGGWGGVVDAGLPSVAFITTFSLAGRELRPALLAALAVGAVLVVVRLVRRDPLQNVIGGFVALGIAAFVANQTGRAEDFYLPGLLINGAYAIVYAVTNLFRFPIIGLIVGLAAGWGMSWRSDPALLRAFTRASWLWAGAFALRLLVQVPLYLGGQVEALGVARVAMGWPMWLVVLWLTYVVVKGSVPAEQWRGLRMSMATLGKRGGSAS